MIESTAEEADFFTSQVCSEEALYAELEESIRTLLAPLPHERRQAEGRRGIESTMIGNAGAAVIDETINEPKSISAKIDIEIGAETEETDGPYLTLMGAHSVAVPAPTLEKKQQPVVEEAKTPRRLTSETCQLLI